MKARHPFFSGLILAVALFSFSASAEGMLPGGGKEPYKVDAEKLDYFDKEQKLIYTGSVIATQGDTKVHGSVMTIYLEKKPGDDSKSQVGRVEFQGPVTVVQKDKTGTGDTAVYKRAEDQWLLKGNVTLTTGDGTVTHGDLLRYNLSDSTAVVTGGGKTGGRVSTIVPVDEDKNSKETKNNKSHNAAAAKH